MSNYSTLPGTPFSTSPKVVYILSQCPVPNDVISANDRVCQGVCQVSICICGTLAHIVDINVKSIRGRV